METKLTAVEWLIDNLKPLYPNIEEFKLIIGLAKDMEKEQIKDAFEDGCIGEMYELNAHYTSEKYYNNFYNVKDN